MLFLGQWICYGICWLIGYAKYKDGKNLKPGKYIFRAYERKNNIDSLIYYSGLLNPYERAAEFSIYRDTVEVRKFWDIEGVNIEF